MSSVAQWLLEITPATPDKRVALMLANRCVELSYPPYRFAINHDIRPPKNLACPLRYDWTRKDRVGLETKSGFEARRWLTDAFILGYTVEQIDAKRSRVGFPHSIAIARRRAAIHQRPKLENDDDDDDIPF